MFVASYKGARCIPCRKHVAEMRMNLDFLLSMNSNIASVLCAGRTNVVVIRLAMPSYL
jgi:hypothetical protein